MIAVTGANGQLGQLVIKHLLVKSPETEVVALVRNPDQAKQFDGLGIEVRRADYDQPATLQSALAGVEKLMFISSSAVGSRVQQHKAVIDTAKLTGVKFIAYTSLLKAENSPLMLAQEHKPTEGMLKESGINSVILRNGWYSENYTQNISGILRGGAVFGAAKEGRFSTAAREDYAEAAANVLLNSEQHIGKTYELAGDSGFTLTEFAAAVGKATGKLLSYNNMSQQDLTQLLVEVGLPAPFAGALADSEVQASKGWLQEDSKTLSTLLGRPTTPIEESIQMVL